MMKIERIARLIAAIKNSEKNGNHEWLNKHKKNLRAIELPSGSGIDSGSKVDIERSKPDRIIIGTSFHHMNNVGMYNGWTEHDVIITPSFICGMDIRVTGQNRNDIKDHIAQVFDFDLREERED